MSLHSSLQYDIAFRITAKIQNIFLDYKHIKASP